MHSTKRVDDWSPLEADLWAFVHDADYEFAKTRPRPWYLFGAEKALPRGTFDRWKAAEEVRAILLRHEHDANG